MGINRNLGGFGASANISGFVANTQITGLITAPQIAPSAIPAGGFSNMTVFTSPGNFTIPPSTTKIKVTVVGGGAGSPGGFRTGITGAAGAGASGSPSSFGAYQTATGGSVTTAGTAPGADLILDGQSLGRYGSSGNTALNQGFTGPFSQPQALCLVITGMSNALTAGSNIYNLNPFAGKGGYGVKIISAPFPVTNVPVTIGVGGGGGGGGGSPGSNLPPGGAGAAGSAGSGVNGGAGGNGGSSQGSAYVGAGGGGGGGAGGFCVGTGGAAGSRGSGSSTIPSTTLATAGQPGAGITNKLGGGSGGNGGWLNESCTCRVGAAGGGSGGHSGIVIVEF